MFILPKTTPRSDIGALICRYVELTFDMRNGRIGFGQP
jgi:hypothetical protein